jgi:hypothetical protein
MVAARRRGVSVMRIAENEGLTRQAVYKALERWEDVPSLPPEGVRVDSGKEVARTLEAFEQMLEDLGEIVGGEAPAHVKLGAITRSVELHERRLRLMASAGYIARNLAAPLIEQETAAMVTGVLEVLRRRGVDEEIVRELMQVARGRVRSPIGALAA